MTTASTLYSPYRAAPATQKPRASRPVAAQATQLQYPWMTAAMRSRLSARSLRLMRSGD